MSKYSRRRINLVFTVSLINIGFATLCTVLSDKFDFIWLRNYNALNILVYVLAAYLAKKEKLNAARILYLLTSCIGIAIISSHIGKNGSVEFTYIFNIGLPYILFSFRREKKLLIVFTILPLLFWFLLYSTDYNLFTFSKLDPTIAKEFIYPIAVSSTISLIIFLLIYFLIINSQYSKKIIHKELLALEASNAKSKFLSTMSHEIRTPLNAVIGLSHILGDNKPRKDQKENIEALNYSGKILLNLLNNVLDFSKMQSTSIELDPIPTDLSAAVRQIKKIHESACLRKNISMNLEIDDEIPIVWLDIVRFNQVINNLVTNAIKFTNKGSVTLRIKKENKTKENLDLLTEIIDTGIGISEDKQETIWKAFTQASTNTNRLYGGTGLGLPIVKSIIESMGSRVHMASKKDQGSHFYFRLNLKIASDNEVLKTVKKKKYTFNQEKVLLVEDNLINVMVAKQILEKVNLKVEVAHNGLEAVNMVKEETFDIILMDIQMPIMDGYTASKEIRKFNKYTPILALSASVFMEVKNKMEESGMNGFIFKPFDPEDLLTQIEEVLIK
jgi:signal transduction histidine kinase